MRYLFLDACPREGNTWKAALVVRNRIARADPGAEFDVIHLRDAGLPFCTGCSLCFRLGRQHCPHSGVMGCLIERMERADGLVFLMTTFNRMPNALAKNFLDHLCFALHRPRFFRGKALVLTTVGGVGAGSAVAYVAGTLKAIGYNRCHKLPIVSYSWNDYQPGEKGRERIGRMAVRFHEDVASGKLKPPAFLVLIPYNLFRGMSRGYAKGTPYETQDGAHWLEDCRAHRAYDEAVPLKNPLKKAFSALFFGLGLLLAKRVTITYGKGASPETGREG